MIKARIRWCSCRVENILTLGKLHPTSVVLFPPPFYFVSIFVPYRIVPEIISSYELARLNGTIFLNNMKVVEPKIKEMKIVTRDSYSYLFLYHLNI